MVHEKIYGSIFSYFIMILLFIIDLFISFSTILWDIILGRNFIMIFNTEKNTFFEQFRNLFT